MRSLRAPDFAVAMSCRALCCVQNSHMQLKHVAIDNRGKGLTLACREPWRRPDLVGLSRARFSRSMERCRLRPSSPRHSIFSLARSLFSSLACSSLGDSLCL